MCGEYLVEQDDAGCLEAVARDVQEVQFGVLLHDVADGVSAYLAHLAVLEVERLQLLVLAESERQFADVVVVQVIVRNAQPFDFARVHTEAQLQRLNCIFPNVCGRHVQLV